MASKRKRQKSLLNYFSAAAPTLQQTTSAAAAVTKDEENNNNVEAMHVDTEEEEMNDKTESNKNDQQQDNTPSPQIIQLAPVIFETDEEDEEEEEIVKPKRKHRLKKRIIQEDDDESEEESTMNNMKQNDDKMEQCDSNDSRIIHDEELNFLDKSDILQERTRGKQVSRYTEALKKLADRKSKLDSYKGEKGPIEKYSVPNTIQLDSDDEEEELDYILSDDNEDLDGFVVDDDMIDGEKNSGTAKDSEMANSIMMEMPAEFSRTRTQSFSKQLAIYIEYLLILSLNPIFDISTNSKYKIAKDSVIRRVTSYKDSMVTSDVWLPSFKEALDKYYNWTYSSKSWDISLHTCEACRTNKPASYKIVLSNNEEEGEGEEDKEVFYVGSECCRKGEMYHQFNHFELHMYNKVKNRVNEEEEAVMMNNNKQEIIYEKLIQSGYIKKLTRDVKELFNIVISVYNLKHQRHVYNDESSSSDSD